MDRFLKASTSENNASQSGGPEPVSAIGMNMLFSNEWRTISMLLFQLTQNRIPWLSCKMKNPWSITSIAEITGYADWTRRTLVHTKISTQFK